MSGARGVQLGGRKAYFAANAKQLCLHLFYVLQPQPRRAATRPRFASLIAGAPEGYRFAAAGPNSVGKRASCVSIHSDKELFFSY